MTQASGSWTDDRHSVSLGHSILEQAAFEGTRFAEGPAVNCALTGQRQSLCLVPRAALLASPQWTGLRGIFHGRRLDRSIFRRDTSLFLKSHLFSQLENLIYPSSDPPPQTLLFSQMEHKLVQNPPLPPLAHSPVEGITHR